MNYRDFESVESARDFKRTLESFGFPKVHWTGRKMLILVLWLVVVAVIAVLFLWREQKDLITIMLAIATLVLAFFYWNLGRYEASTEKYYDRLSLANKRYDELSPNKYLMFVFLELDNLEYVIEKYKMGYISHQQAFRGLKTFYTYCWNVREKVPNGKFVFLNVLAEEWVGRAGYLSSTIKVAKAVCEEIRVKRDEQLRLQAEQELQQQDDEKQRLAVEERSQSGRDKWRD